MSIFKRNRLSLFLFTLCFSLVLLLSGRGFINIASAAPAPQLTSIVAQKSSSLSTTKDVKKTVLSNGLTILTKEVHTAPVITVQVWYKIGSLNEEPGVNGIAHQLEHMLFKGTKERPIQFGRLFSALGSDSNAFTSFDKTAYYGTVERNKLQALLVLEADRMKNAIIATPQLNSEKKVVLSEIQGYENSPSYRLGRAVMKSAFPNHPYGLSVGGTKTEIEQFSTEKVNEYYRNYYSPDNAVLVIVGDFQTEQTLTSVKEIFGNIAKTDIKRKSPPLLSDTLPRKTAQKPIILKQPGSSYLIQAVYPGVP
ncbi:MAG TPA: pitrilysin family protein, partial [Allocoleopsis sp.]